MDKTALTFFTILCLICTVFLVGFKISAKADPDVIPIEVQVSTPFDPDISPMRNLTCPAGTTLNFTYTISQSKLTYIDPLCLTVDINIRVDPAPSDDFSICLKHDGSLPTLDDYDEIVDIGWYDWPEIASVPELTIGTYYFMVYNNITAYETPYITPQNYCDVSVYIDFYSSYKRVLQDYDTLNSTHNVLLSDYTGLQSELDTIRNLMYLFIATTVILIATTVYFAIRKSKIR